jgi:hypothetical protein
MCAAYLALVFAAVTALVLASCGSTAPATGENLVPGNLTVTGIPAEFEGISMHTFFGVIPGKETAVSTKSSLLLGFSAYNAHRYLSLEHPFPVITNGELKLPVYERSRPASAVIEPNYKTSGYTGNEKWNLKISFPDNERYIVSADFNEVQFEQGIATVQWNEAIIKGGAPKQSAAPQTIAARTSAAPQTVQAQSSGPVIPPDTDFEVTRNADGKTLTISGYRGSARNIVIPVQINGFPVTVIGEKTFENKSITNAVIPDGVTAIKWRAFSSNRLDSVTIPNSVTSIESYAFYNNQLSVLTLGKGLGAVGGIQNDAFNGNQPVNITIAKDVSTISAATGFEQSFISFYESQKRAPGTYVKNWSVWSKQ